MMHPFTVPVFRQACSLLAITLLSFNASAQTAPAWQNARAVGTNPTVSGAAAIDANGNTYEVGSFSGTTTFDGLSLTSQGNFDGYLAKYTPAGTIAWVRQLGSTGSDVALSVALDAAGNAYVVGDFTNSIVLSASVMLDGGNTTTSKAFAVRFSPQGTPEWAQQSVPTPDNAPTASGVGTDALGHVYITGFFTRTITIGSTTVTLPNYAHSVFTARLSAATGALESLASAFYYATSTGPGTFDYFYPQLAVTPTGEMYILNAFNQSPLFSNTTLTSRGGNDVLIAKYNAQGNFEWAQQFGGPGEEHMRDGVVDAAGNLYIVGSFTGPATFGSTSLPGAGNFDGCLVKYSTQGTMQWVQSIGGPNVDGLTSVSLDTSGSPYVTGYFTNTAQFGSATLTSTGSRDIAVAAYTPQGQLRWAQQAGGPGADTGTYLGLDATGEVYVHGLFTGSCNFGPLSIATSATGYVSFVARLGNRTLATSARPTFSIGLYPNPATTTVHLLSVPVGNQVQLLDAVGRTARTTAVAPGGSVSLQGITPGLYVIRTTDAQGRQYTGRLAVE